MKYRTIRTTLHWTPFRRLSATAARCVLASLVAVAALGLMIGTPRSAFAQSSVPYCLAKCDSQCSFNRNGFYSKSGCVDACVNACRRGQ